MKNKITFWKLLGNWFVVALILGLINIFLIKSSVLHNLILAGLGIILLIYPIYPANLESKYTPKQCRLFIRILAVIEILFSFAIRTNFKQDDYVAFYSADVVSTYSYRPDALIKLGIIIVVIIAIIVAFVVQRRKNNR